MSAIPANQESTMRQPSICTVRAADLLPTIQKFPGQFFPGIEHKDKELQRVCREELESRGLAEKREGEWYLPAQHKLNGVDRVDSIAAGLKVREVWGGVPIGFDPATENPRDVERVKLIIGHKRHLKQFMAQRGLRCEKTAWPAYREYVGVQHLKETIGIKSYSQLCEWTKTGGRIARGDISENRGAFAKPKAEFSPEIKLAYDTLRMKSSSSDAKCYRDAKVLADARGLEIPAIRTVETRYTEETDPGAEIMGREGDRLYEMKAEPKIHNEDRHSRPDPYKRNIDGHRHDIKRWILDPRKGRRWVRPMGVYIEDDFTGFIEGYAGGYSEAYGVVEPALVMAWELHGGCEIVECDYGSVFAGLLSAPRFGEEFESLFAEASKYFAFTLRRPQEARKPWRRGTIESRFRWPAQWDEEDHLYCGSNPSKRPHDHNKRLAECLFDERYSLQHWVEVEQPAFIKQRNETPTASSLGLAPSVLHERKTIVRKFTPEQVRVGWRMKRIVIRTISERGIKYGPAWYGQMEPETSRMLDKKVAIMRGPDAGSLTVCDAKTGEFLYVATNKKLSGETWESLEKAMKFKASVRKRRREELKDRTVDLLTVRGQIEHVRQRQLEADAAKQRKLMPAPPEKEFRIVRPDLAAKAEEIEGAHAQVAWRESAAAAGTLSATGTDDAVGREVVFDFGDDDADQVSEPSNVNFVFEDETGPEREVRGPQDEGDGDPLARFKFE